MCARIARVNTRISNIGLLLSYKSPNDPMPMRAEKKDAEWGELPFSPHRFTNANPMPKGNRLYRSATKPCMTSKMD